MSQDLSYYAARAIEERRLAMAASDPRARGVHLELAAEYALRAGMDIDLADEGDAEGEQRTG